jgi:hypothetical protein
MTYSSNMQNINFKYIFLHTKNDKHVDHSMQSPFYAFEDEEDEDMS